MNIFLDTTCLFDAIENSSIRNTLDHAINAGNTLYVPLTALGEILLVCINENRSNDLNSILSFCRERDILFRVPSEKLRECCMCIDEADKRNALDYTDKTNLAYATANDADYFLTTDKKMLHNFNFECSDVTKIIDYNGLRKFLGK